MRQLRFAALRRGQGADLDLAQMTVQPNARVLPGERCGLPEEIQ